MDRSGRYEESTRTQGFRSRLLVAGLAASAAAAAHTEASFAAVQVAACVLIVEADGTQNLAREEDEQGHIVVEGSFLANCDAHRDCRDRWHGRGRCRFGRAWSAKHCWYRTPVLYSQVNPRTTKFR